MIHKISKNMRFNSFSSFMLFVTILLGIFVFACKQQDKGAQGNSTPENSISNSTNSTNSTSKSSLLEKSGLGKSSSEEKEANKSESEESVPVAWHLSSEAKKTYYYLAMLEISHSNDQKASAAAVLELCKLNPSPATYYEGASQLFLSNNIEAAVRVGQEGLERYPDSGNLLLLMAEINLSMGGNSEKSVEYLSKAVKSGVNSPEKILRIVDTLIRVKRYKEAEDIFSLIPEPRKGKEDEGAGVSLSVYLCLKGRIVAGKGDHEGGKALLKKALALDPEFAEAWAELAFWQEKDGNLSAAEASYQKLLKIAPENTAIWLALVRINIKLERPDEALYLVLKGPQRFAYFMSSAMMFTESKLFHQAEQVYLEAAKLPDATDDVYLYLSYVSYEQTKNVDKSVVWLDNVKKGGPFYEKAMLLKIQAYSDAGLYDKALAVAKEKEEEMPTQKSFYLAEIGILYKQKKLQEVDAAFERVLKNFPKDTDLLFSKGAYLSESGKKDEAMEVMESIIAIDPKNSAALNYVGYTLADSGKDLDRAYVLIKDALANDPNNPHIIDSMAWVEYKLKNYKGAFEQIERAISFNPVEPEIWEHYGDIALVLNKKDEARKAYEMSLKLSPQTPELVKRKLESLGK